MSDKIEFPIKIDLSDIGVLFSPDDEDYIEITDNEALVALSDRLNEARGVGWVDAETKPQAYQEVLAWRINKEHPVIAFWDGAYWIMGDEFATTIFVSHWMELPSPPVK